MKLLRLTIRNARRGLRLGHAWRAARLNNEISTLKRKIK
jgi:hypothetical protein